MLLKLKFNNFMNFKESEFDFTVTRNENIENTTFVLNKKSIDNKEKSIKLYKYFICFGLKDKDIIYNVMFFLKNIILKNNINFKDYTKEESYIELTFICNKIKYVYSIKFNSMAILKENLISYAKGEPKTLYVRENGIIQGISNKYLYELKDNQSFLMWYSLISKINFREFFENINFNPSEIKENSINFIKNIDFLHISKSFYIINKMKKYKRVQLICSANNPTLIKKRFNLFRKYQVWFTEKDYDSKTILYSAGESDVRKERDLEELYLNGRFCDMVTLNEI